MILDNVPCIQILLKAQLGLFQSIREIKNVVSSQNRFLFEVNFAFHKCFLVLSPGRQFYKRILFFFFGSIFTDYRVIVLVSNVLPKDYCELNLCLPPE